MAVEPRRCAGCGEAEHGDATCPARLIAVGSTPAAGPCNCLPDPAPGWAACASCGLPQAPGKTFCGFCGRRWVTASLSEPVGRDPARSATTQA